MTSVKILTSAGQFVKKESLRVLSIWSESLTPLDVATFQIGITLEMGGGFTGNCI